MAKHKILLGPVVIGEERHETGATIGLSEADAKLLTEMGVVKAISEASKPETPAKTAKPAKPE